MRERFFLYGDYRVRTVKSILNIISTVLVVLLIILALLLAGVRVFGLTPYTVLSGSMEPNYHVGSLVYIKKTPAAASSPDSSDKYSMLYGHHFKNNEVCSAQ